MRRVKKENWIMRIYRDNKLYVWFLIGIVSFSGISIGIAMGNNSNKNDVKLTKIDSENSYTDIKNVNTIPEKVATSKKTETEESDKNVETKSENKKANQSNSKKEEVKQVKEQEKNLQFSMPLEGEIIKEFSESTLVYSNTLEEWISHIGIDISANESTPVKAVEDGIITEIKEDPRYGYTIIIDHGQGYKSVYCNLSTLDMVSIGKNIEKGQVISGVGNTALFEIKDKMHLHFELLKNGVLVNPMEYLKG